MFLQVAIRVSCASMHLPHTLCMKGQYSISSREDRATVGVGEKRHAIDTSRPGHAELHSGGYAGTSEIGFTSGPSF